MGRLLVLLSLPLGGACGNISDSPGGNIIGSGGETEQRSVTLALAHLAREVPLWPRENACFSCHHSGDAARALFVAHQLGRGGPAAVWRDTLGWLSAPVAWDDQEGDPAFTDKVLARLQFTAALAAAASARLVREPRSLEVAGDLAVKLQDPSGAWVLEPGNPVGSPATWGTYLATAILKRALEALGAERHSASIHSAGAWLARAPVENTYQAAAVWLGQASSEPLSRTPAQTLQRQQCLNLWRRGRAENGGWGPYANAPPEVFDTALVLLALSSAPRTEETRRWRRDGRSFLVASQLEDGSWPATTRPRGGQSHAQATSTSAWATLALLLTTDE